MRLPLDDIPDLLYKLCSGAPLSWADITAAYGAEAKEGASAAKDGAANMLDYLTAHGVTAKLNAAVNELAKVTADTPTLPFAPSASRRVHFVIYGVAHTNACCASRAVR